MSTSKRLYHLKVSPELQRLPHIHDCQTMVVVDDDQYDLWKLCYVDEIEEGNVDYKIMIVYDLLDISHVSTVYQAVGAYVSNVLITQTKYKILDNVDMKDVDEINESLSDYMIQNYPEYLLQILLDTSSISSYDHNGFRAKLSKSLLRGVFVDRTITHQKIHGKYVPFSSTEDDIFGLIHEKYSHTSTFMEHSRFLGVTDDDIIQIYRETLDRWPLNPPKFTIPYSSNNNTSYMILGMFLRHYAKYPITIDDEFTNVISKCKIFNHGVIGDSVIQYFNALPEHYRNQCIDDIRNYMYNVRSPELITHSLCPEIVI